MTLPPDIGMLIFMGVIAVIFLTALSLAIYDRYIVKKAKRKRRETKRAGMRLTP